MNDSCIVNKAAQSGKPDSMILSTAFLISSLIVIFCLAFRTINTIIVLIELFNSNSLISTLRVNKHQEMYMKTVFKVNVNDDKNMNHSLIVR